MSFPENGSQYFTLSLFDSFKILEQLFSKTFSQCGCLQIWKTNKTITKPVLKEYVRRVRTEDITIANHNVILRSHYIISSL